MINLHWSGEGYSNWGEGCQVMAGRAFMDPAGVAISCEDFDANGYSSLGGSQTQGAFNLVPDLFLALGGALSTKGQGVELRYTLLDREDVETLAPGSLKLLETARDRLKSYL